MIPAILTTTIVLGTALLTFGVSALAAAIRRSTLRVLMSSTSGCGGGRAHGAGALEGGAPILFGLMSKWFGAATPV
jgi:hypothetical protein